MPCTVEPCTAPKARPIAWHNRAHPGLRDRCQALGAQCHHDGRADTAIPLAPWAHTDVAASLALHPGKSSPQQRLHRCCHHTRVPGSHRRHRTTHAVVIVAVLAPSPHHHSCHARARSHLTSLLNGQAIGSGTATECAPIAHHCSNGCTNAATMLACRARIDATAQLVPVPLSSSPLPCRHGSCTHARSHPTSPLDEQAIGTGTAVECASIAHYRRNDCTNSAAMLVCRARTDITAPLMPVLSPSCLHRRRIAVAAALVNGAETQT